MAGRVLDVHNVEGSRMAFPVADNAHTAHVAPAGDHAHIARVELHVVRDLARADVDHRRVVNLHNQEIKNLEIRYNSVEVIKNAIKFSFKDF